MEYASKSHRSRYSYHDDFALKSVSLASRPRHCSAKKIDSMAKTRFPAILELQVKSRTIPYFIRAQVTDRGDGARYCLLGRERIANELLLELDIHVSPQTVRKYLSNRPGGDPRGNQRWQTFLQNHAQAIVACDFCLVVTASFRVLYVLVIIEHGSRRLLHCNTTRYPAAEWTR